MPTPAMDTDLRSLAPFEICSIRPPTENFSLTFRMARNCYWNKCTFCPVYKFGTRFSKRTLEGVLADVRRAKRLDAVMEAEGITGEDTGYDARRAADLIARIRRAQHRDEQEIPSGPDMAGAPEELQWFRQWIKDSPDIADSIEHLMGWRLGGRRTCFLGDADGLMLSGDFLSSVIGEVKLCFPEIDRFTIYGRTASAARRWGSSDLESIRNAGLNRIHFGIESGADAVLKDVRKGETRSDHLDGCRKAIEAGLSCSVYVMPGLGGRARSHMHAQETASLLSEIGPDYVRLRSLRIFPQTPLAEARDRGAFVEPDDETIVREIRTMVAGIDAETRIMSDSASNLLSINGRLPEERRAMLYIIDQYLDLSPRQKRLFGLQARLQAFEGQYGGFTEDIIRQLKPYIASGRLELDAVPDREAAAIAELVKKKLMP